MSMIGGFYRVPAARLENMREDPDSVNELFEEDGDGIDIDKAWHGIHYLLTGTAWEVSFPLGAAVLGGEEFGDDIGYGPARFLTPDEVKEVAAALEKTSPEDLARKFNPQKMTEAGIYPEIWGKRDRALDYLLSYFEELKDYYSEAAKNNEAMILCLT